MLFLTLDSPLWYFSLMTKGKLGLTVYSFLRLFWSIYFVLFIGLIGLFMGYGVTVACFLISFILKPFPKAEQAVRYFAEYVQCFSIRGLLRLQPWLICHENLQAIYGFYDQYGTRKVMFVSNHRSNLDTFLLISLIPGLRGLAKQSLYQNFFFAPIMLIIGFVPVKKGSIENFLIGLKQLKTKILDRDRAILIFPETTRCHKNFPSIQKFSTAIFETAMDSSALIVPIYLGGTDRLLGRGDFLLNPFEPVTVKIFPPMKPQSFASTLDLTKAVRGLLLDEHARFSLEQRSLCS